MLKNVSKKVKIILFVLIGVIVVGAGLAIWGFATGGLKIGAYQYWFPYYLGQGTVSGKVTCQSPCSLFGAEVDLWLHSGSDSEVMATVDVSSDGSYSFNRVPLGNYYQVIANKECPPTTRELGNCDGYGPGFDLTEDNPRKIANLTLKPEIGRLVILARQIIVNPSGRGYGQRQSNYASYCQGTSTTGEWDCPVAEAKVVITQGDNSFEKITNSTGTLIQYYRDYRMSGSVNIEIKRGVDSGSGSTNVIGCQNNTKKIYLK